MSGVQDQKGSSQWLRWILVLPAALTGAVMAIAFSLVLHLTVGRQIDYLFGRLTNQPPVTEVLPIALVPVAFVLAGLKTAPKHLFFVGSCLALIVGLLNFYFLYLCLLSVYGNRSLQGYIAGYVIGTLASIFTIYLMRLNAEQKIRNKSIVWILIGYILFIIMIA